MLLSAIFFIMLSSASLLFILKNGLLIDSFSFLHLKVERLYIKYDEKIDLYAKKVTLLPKKESLDLDRSQLLEGIKDLLNIVKYFNQIEIDELTFGKQKLSINYENRDQIYLTLLINGMQIYTKADLSKNAMLFDTTLKSKDLEASANGALLLSSPTLAMQADLNFFENSAKLNLHSDTKRFTYDLALDKSVQNYQKIIALFKLDKEIEYYLLDALNFDKLALKSFRGYGEYDLLSEAYKHIEATASLDGVSYKYDPDLQKVDAKRVDLIFSDATLKIAPISTTSYGFDLQDSRLSIDFSEHDIPLWLQLRLNGMLNDEILDLLKHYGIEIPLKQTKGSLLTSLDLRIALESLDVEAEGRFVANEASINYLGLDFDIFNLDLELKNTHIKSYKTFAKYDDMLSAFVGIDLDVKKDEGELTFDIEHANLGGFKLINSDLRDELALVISPTKSYFRATPTKWSFGILDFSIDAIEKMEFDLSSEVLRVKNSSIKIKEIATAYLNGEYSFESHKGLIELDFIPLDRLKSASKIKLEFDHALHLSSNDTVEFSYKNEDIALYNLEMLVQKDRTRFVGVDLAIDGFLKTKLDGYIFYEPTFTLQASSTELFDGFFKHKDSISVKFLTNEDSFGIEVEKFALNATIDELGYRVDITSPHKMLPYIEQFKGYDLGVSALSINRSFDDDEIFILGNISTPYALFTNQNDLINSYRVEASYNTKDKKSSIAINDKIFVVVGKNIAIKSEDLGFNLDGILEFLAQGEQDSKPLSTQITLDAKDSYIYISKNRFLISEKLRLWYKNGILNINLTHKDGSAKLRLKDGTFYLIGDGFNDKFMSKLFAKSEFKGGVLKFSINGHIRDFEGVMYIEKSTIKDYALLNNILAFVNTVPSLVTFSLPGYSSSGLPIKEAYLKFKYFDSFYNFSDLYVNSKEMNIVGFGNANVDQNSVDLELNLVSDIGSTLSKVPLVGHILLNGEALSTTLKVDGDLNDPTIRTQVARDIMVAPLNIIKRTLMLPFDMLK